MQRAAKDRKLKNHFSTDEENNIFEWAKAGLEWFEANPEATSDELNFKRVEYELKFGPIYARAMTAAGAN